MPNSSLSTSIPITRSHPNYAPYQKISHKFSPLPWRKARRQMSMEQVIATILQEPPGNLQNSQVGLPRGGEMPLLPQHTIMCTPPQRSILRKPVVPFLSSRTSSGSRSSSSCSRRRRRSKYMPLQTGGAMSVEEKAPILHKPSGQVLDALRDLRQELRMPELPVWRLTSMSMTRRPRTRRCEGGM